MENKVDFLFKASSFPKLRMESRIYRDTITLIDGAISPEERHRLEARFTLPVRELGGYGNEWHENMDGEHGVDVRIGIATQVFSGRYGNYHKFADFLVEFRYGKLRGDDYPYLFERIERLVATLIEADSNPDTLF